MQAQNVEFFLKNHPPNKPLTPKLIETTIKFNVARRSLSPFLQRKIHEKSFIIYNRDLSPSEANQKDQAVTKQYTLPFIFPNKPSNTNPLQIYKKNLKVLLNEANKKKKEKIDLRIMNFTEKIGRLIDKSHKTSREREKLTERLTAKASEKYERNKGQGFVKEFQVKTLEKEFQKLAVKIGEKPLKKKRNERK